MTSVMYCGETITMYCDGHKEVVKMPEDYTDVTVEQIADMVNEQSSWTAEVVDGGLTLSPPTYTISIVRRQRGHRLILDEFGDWVYEETGEKEVDDKPCKRCGKPPTPEGYDACIGYLEGIQYACCGHGETKPVRIYKK